MKRPILIYISIIIIHFAFINKAISQTQQQITDTAKVHRSKAVGLDGKIFEVFDEEPKFKGGDEGKFIHEHLNYPQAALDSGVQGTVCISVIISVDGEMSDIKVLKGVPMGCTEETIRVIKLMGNNWIPGKVNGQAVMSRKYFNIKFTIPK